MIRNAVWIFLLLIVIDGSAQPVGNTYVAGTTWYDLQHVGSCGRMIGVDDQGNVHIVWMKGYTSIPTEERHIFHNLWNPETGQFAYSTGLRVDSTDRAGYATLATMTNGCAVPAFHWVNVQDESGVAVSVCLEMQPIIHSEGYPWALRYPVSASSGDSLVFMIMLDFDDMGEYIEKIRFARGVIDWQEEGIPSGFQWTNFNGNPTQVLDSTWLFTHTIAVSRRSPRIVAGWSRNSEWRDEWGRNNYDNNIVLRTSDDTGLNWSAALNITNSTLPDTALYNAGGDWRICNRDTLRAYPDLSLLFDQNDALHAAFTVIPYFFWWNDEVGPHVIRGASLIYHWNESTGQFSLVADGRIPYECGAWQTIVQRPSLAVDEATGFLYCAYVRYDTLQLSEAGYPNADIWISVSTDGGSRWSMGTNVTRSTPEQLPAPAGASLCEREPTLAETVSGGFLHLSYILDRDAGACVQDPPEGVATSNDMIYQRIPVDSIAATPLLPNYPLHWDSTGFLRERHVSVPAVPEQIVFHPAYPNPFNSATIIRFELPRAMKIRLRAFNLLGQRVDILAEGELSAGAHEIRWDAEHLSSGIYFISLEHSDFTQTQKVMLLR